MPTTIKDPLSRVAISLFSRHGDTELASGTGFFYELSGELFLLTARHNVTGRHADTNIPLHTFAALPDNLWIGCWKTDGTGWIGLRVDLYDAEGVPDWFEHPVHREKVDAVALSIALPQGVRAFPINLEELDAVPVAPGLDVFILGYPRGIRAGGLLPIWKRGSIASEPEVEVGGLPKLLVDTATRQGMSGAPVLAEISGYWQPEGTDSLDERIIGRGRRFIGLYSGRVGDDEFLAQLGIVWKGDALLEIMKAKRRPDPSSPTREPPSQDDVSYLSHFAESRCERSLD